MNAGARETAQCHVCGISYIPVGGAVRTGADGSDLRKFVGLKDEMELESIKSNINISLDSGGK